MPKRRFLSRLGPFLLTLLFCIVVGGSIPFIAGLAGGGGGGAYLALGLSNWVTAAAAFFWPKSSLFFLAVATGSAAGVVCWGWDDPKLFWGMFGLLTAWSLPGCVLGALVGWSGRRFAERLERLRQAGISPAGGPGDRDACRPGRPEP